jgi:hypothetical protein
MKKMIRLILVLFIMTYSALVVLADPPAPPTGGNGNPGNGQYVGAPIDNGFLLLIIFALVFGGIRIYSAYKSKKLASNE